jgi:23S rRNA (uracil1939-C5)-methyltransferase
MKQQHVREALEHIGLLKDITVHPTLASNRIFEYRNKMEFSCSDKSWVLPEELDCPARQADFAIGLHVPGTYHKVIDIDECCIQPLLGNAILNDIREYIKQSGVPVYGIRSHSGYWRFVMLRHSVANDQWMVNLITAAENLDILKPLGDQLRTTYPEIVSVVNNITAKKAAIAVGDIEIPVSGETTLKEKVGKYIFEISSNSFFQTNTNGADQLYNIVRQYADLSGNEVVVDLYCGTGTISIFLSDQAREVIGMEINENALSDARRNCRLNRIVNCRFIQGDIKTNISGLTDKPDVMIIDPPRAGMHKKVVEQIRHMAPKKIVYISCNPATLARDLNMLKEGYMVKEVQPVDMFPHTYHIESVARLETV